MGVYLRRSIIYRLVALDKLDKNRKTVANNSSDDDDSSVSTKNVKRNKKKEKEREERLIDHLKEIENGEHDSERLSSESEVESVVSRSVVNKKNRDKSDDSLMSEAERMAKKRLLESSDSEGMFTSFVYRVIL